LQAFVVANFVVAPIRWAKKVVVLGTFAHGRESLQTIVYCCCRLFAFADFDCCCMIRWAKKKLSPEVWVFDVSKLQKWQQWQ
jgi:hypothetical protein